MEEKEVKKEVVKKEVVKTPRVSKITKFIERKYRLPHQYEMLTVSLAYEEDVTWRGMQERQIKSARMTQTLMKDFEDTRKEVFVQLGLEDASNNAFVENKSTGVSVPVPTSPLTIEGFDDADDDVTGDSL